MKKKALISESERTGKVHLFYDTTLLEDLLEAKLSEAGIAFEDAWVETGVPIAGRLVRVGEEGLQPISYVKLLRTAIKDSGLFLQYERASEVESGDAIRLEEGKADCVTLGTYLRGECMEFVNLGHEDRANGFSLYSFPDGSNPNQENGIISSTQIMPLRLDVVAPNYAGPLKEAYPHGAKIPLGIEEFVTEVCAILNSA